jgi:hypothetical protein
LNVSISNAPIDGRSNRCWTFPPTQAPMCIYESSLRAGPGWRESLYRHQGCLEASDCGRLGRQAAGHPWSALRVVKSRRKDCPTAEVLPRPKQQLCIQNGTRAHYLNYLQRRRVRRGKKRRQSDWLANQMDRKVMDRQIEDRQTGRNKADERWYPSRPCSVLSSGL